MTPNTKDSAKKNTSPASIAVAAALGAVLLGIVLYRLMPKAKAGVGPTVREEGVSVDRAAPVGTEPADLLSALPILQRPLPQWGSRPVKLPSVLKDPFVAEGRFHSALAEAAAAKLAARTTVADAADEPEFELKGIVRDADGRAAYVNDRVLFVGDTILGYTVKAIGKWEVTLERHGQSTVLSLPVKSLVEEH